MNSSFLKYCCLHKAISFTTDDPSVNEVLNAITPCYNDDMDFQQMDVKTRIQSSIRTFMSSTYNAAMCPVETADIIGTCDKPTAPEFNAYICVWAIILAMIVFSNIFVIVSIIKVESLRQFIPNLFIMSLSMSDLCVGLFIIPFKIAFAKFNLSFCFSLNVCRFYIIADITFFVISIINLLVIAVDRHLALNYPHKYQRWMTRKNAKIIIVSTWLYGLFCGALSNLKLDDINEDPIGIKGMNCSMYNNKIYVYILYILHFIIPVIVMGIIYVRIFMMSKPFSRTLSE